MFRLKAVLGSESAVAAESEPSKRVSIREKLLIQEAQELGGGVLPSTCHVHFPSTELHSFFVTVKPDEGIYAGGSFTFHVFVPPEYNLTVTCSTRVWHPNISEDGAVCLSILRQNSLDGYGWAPTRRLKDVALGLHSLFFDLLDFDDPLNSEAAEQWRRDREAFLRRVKDSIRRSDLLQSRRP